ncbi:hypothetical protein [Kutzneria buriramensis]|nr:hypothetical protein [Kutzneria buriramensis]
MHPELRATPHWQRTDNAFFPVVAQVDGAWWVLRINSFPDHPLWTLFVDGTVRFDVDDAPPAWGEPASRKAPALAKDVERAVLAPVEGFVAYGSEVGDPCDNPFCCG